MKKTVTKQTTKTPITYYGGKQSMLKHILPLVPKHTIYTEAFCGGAALFFAKEPAQAEVINDLNGDLVNFYNTLQLDYPALKAKIDTTLHARDTHEHARHILSHREYFDHIDRAWAVWALSKTSFSSKLDGSFGYDFRGYMPKRLRNAKEEFSELLAKRLEHTTIECRDALKVISTYDSPDTFHFIDPPYIGSNCGHYSGMFGSDDLSHLLDLLSQAEGKAMLTMYPNDLIEDYAKRYGWTIHRIERTICSSKTTRRKQEEWIVCNYSVETQALE